MPKKHPTILFGITSGIAAHKMIEVIQTIGSEGITARVILTPHASRMVSGPALAEITGYPIHTSLFPDDFDYQEVLKRKEVDHIQLADAADLFVIAPATANTIAKLAHGIADDFLTTTALATTAPVLVCPSMNVHMWEHPTVQENLAILRARGVFILPPVEGDLACGYTGMGRLPEPDAILAEIHHLLATRHQLAGKHVIVTAGGTSEPIDGVRMLTNRASGKMGIAIAQECRLRGAEVTLLLSSSCRDAMHCVSTQLFTTADDLESLLQTHVPEADMIFHTAAVADFTTSSSPLPKGRLGGVGKLDSTRSHTLTLHPREKIITQIKAWNPQIKLIGFKAVYQVSPVETQSRVPSGTPASLLIEEAEKKRVQTDADFIVANDVGQPGIGFEAEENEVWVVAADTAPKHLPRAPKRTIARHILDIVLSR